MKSYDLLLRQVFRLFFCAGVVLVSASLSAWSQTSSGLTGITCVQIDAQYRVTLARELHDPKRIFACTAPGHLRYDKGFFQAQPFLSRAFYDSLPSIRVSKRRFLYMARKVELAARVDRVKVEEKKHLLVGYEDFNGVIWVRLPRTGAEYQPIK